MVNIINDKNLMNISDRIIYYRFRIIYYYILHIILYIYY